MADSHDLEPASRSSRHSRASRVATEPDLSSAEDPQALLLGLGRRLRGWVSELSLSSDDPLEGEIAAWRDAAAGLPAARRTVTVAGQPAWHLSLGLLREGEAADPLATQAGMLVAVWRGCGDTVVRAESRLARRTRELDVLQSLGRRAAEARTPMDLFASVLSVLQQAVDLDVVVVGYETDGFNAAAFLARPVCAEPIEALVRRAAGVLGSAPIPERPTERIELDTYDPAHGERSECGDEAVVLLPLMRRGRPVATLLAVPAKVANEPQLRLLFGAANQLAVHLDRILTVREAEADRFRSIVESMPQGVLLMDRGLRILQANPAARAMLSVAVGEHARPVLERCGLSELAEAASGQAEARQEDGRLWSVTASRFCAERRHDDGLVMVLTDVTEARRLQEQLAQSEKMSSLGQLISGVTHELNNPLATILGYSQLIRATTRGDEQLVERLEILKREAERCRKIVHNLLAFARRRGAERKPFSLNQAVESVLQLVGYQLRVDDITVTRELDPGLPSIDGDGHALQQVLVNLVNNAQQAIHGAGRGGEIRIRTRREGANAILEVEDDGPGIPLALQSKVFDPFVSTKPEGQGTGLGLSLVHGIVTAHGGEIRIVPGPRKGTLVRIALPLGRPADAPVSVPRPVIRPASVGPARILVVDDEEAVARLICETLAEDGHRTERVHDGRGALARLAEQDFDLVISDVRMPGTDARVLVDELSSVRLLLTTGATMDSEPEELAATAGCALLHKPFDLDELRRRVRDTLTG